MQSTYFRFGKDADSQMYAQVDDETGSVGVEAEVIAAEAVAAQAPVIPINTRFDAMLQADGAVYVLRMSDPSTGVVAEDNEARAMSEHLGFNFLEGFRDGDQPSTGD